MAAAPEASWASCSEQSAPQRPDGMSVAVVSSKPSPECWAGLAAKLSPERAWLAAVWQADIADHVTARPGWRGPVRFLVVRNPAEEAIAILPFAKQRYMVLDFLSLAGLYWPHRGLPAESHACEAIAVEIAEVCTNATPRYCLRFGPVTADDPLMPRLIEQLELRGWRNLVSPRAARWIVDLPDSTEAFRSRLSRDRVKGIGRTERKLQREHPSVRVCKFTRENCGDWWAVLRDLGRVERDSWLPERSGDFLFEAPHLRSLWMELFSMVCVDLIPHVWLIYVGDQPVAYSFALDTGRVRHSIACHHSKAFRKYSLGFLLDWKQFEDAIALGIQRVDLGHGDSGYKREAWRAQAALWQNEHLLFPPGLMGYGLRQVASFVRRMRR